MLETKLNNFDSDPELKLFPLISFFNAEKLPLPGTVVSNEPISAATFVMLEDELSKSLDIFLSVSNFAFALFIEVNSLFVRAVLNSVDFVAILLEILSRII